MTDPMTSWAQPEGGAPETPPAATPLATPPAKGSGRATNILLGIALLVAVGGLAFAGGRITAPASASGFPGGRAGFPAGSFDPNQAGSFDPNQAGGLGQAGLGGNRALAITGTVKSLDGSTLVLTTADGTEMTIDVSGSTYHAETAATASDVTLGSSVSVTVAGFGGFRGPNASADPNGDARGAPIMASDVIIVGK